MNALSKFETFYSEIKENIWYLLFSFFCRFVLAFAFIFAGGVKIMGERFANGLSIKHPMGAYLEALHHTGYYYTFIGMAQVVAAILLIIPKTVTLGAMLYLPIIINIWLLSFALRFEGSFITSPLMVLANLYLIAWNYDRLKYILPMSKFSSQGILKKPTNYTYKFPFFFFSGVIFIIGLFVLLAQFGYDQMPRNSMRDCKSQFIGTKNEVAGFEFCECIHENGRPLDACIEEFEKFKK